MGEVSEDGGDEDEEEEDEEEEVASFEGKVLLSSFSGFRLTWSPRRGVGLSELMASLVFGFESVPRTEEEWDVSTIVADQGSFCCMNCMMYSMKSQYG